MHLKFKDVYFFSLFTVLFFIFNVTTHAYEIEGESKTFFSGSETKDNKKSYPFFEYLSIQVFNENNDSFRFGGWLKYDTADKKIDNKFDSELSYAFLSLKNTNINTTFNIGRIPIYESPSVEIIDGVQIKKSFNSGLKISAYLGSPAELDFDNRSGDNIIGGEISYRHKNFYNIGISYLKEMNNNKNYREEAAVDLWIHPLDKIEMSGKSNYNLQNSGWMSHDYALSFKPNNQIKIDLLSSWYSYDKYFTSVTTPAFMLQSGILNPQEELFITGIDGEFHGKNLVYALDFKSFNYKTSHNSSYYGGKVIYNSSKLLSASISLHRMDGGDNKLRYYELKTFMSKEFTKKISSYISIIDLLYDEKINDVKNSYTASASSQYKFSNKAKSSLNIEYSHNPDFNKEVKIFIKFLYNFGAI